MKSPRVFFKVAALLIVLQQSVIQAFAQPSTPRDSTWITDGAVTAVAYSKGLTYIGGDFTYVGPNTGYGAALSTATGAPDLKFPKVNGPIEVVIADGADGWYIGGAFTKVGDLTRNWLAHIKADGTVDPNWDPNAAGNFGTDPLHIHTMVMNGSTIYVGGSFTSMGGQQRRGIAALNASTGQVTVWNPNANSWVLAIAIKGETVYVGGKFSSIGGKSTGPLAAIDMTTGIATAWNPRISGVQPEVHAIVPVDTSIFIGGKFTSAGGRVRNHLAEVGIALGEVTVWNPNATDAVYALALSGSTLYAGGAFLKIGGLPRDRIGALSIHSSTPLSWNPGANNVVLAIYVNGSTVYAGGYFTSIGGQSRYRLAALDATTGKATAWNSQAQASVRGFAANNSGSLVYAGGQFKSIGGQPRNRFAALNASTGIATAWNPNVNIDGVINTMTVSGSNVYIGGAFTGQRNRIAAINTTTGALAAWNPNANGHVHAIIIHNATVYVGGKFTAIGGQARNQLAALDINTGLAKNWNPNVSADGVYTIVANGATVYAGGDFQSVGGQPREALAAIDANTGQVTAWNPNLNASSIVYAMTLSGSTLYIGGNFNTVKGQTRNRLAAVDVTTAEPTKWNPDANGIVRVLALSGANVYAGGAFTSIGGQPRNYLAAMDRAVGMPTPWHPDPNSFGSGQSLIAVSSAILVGGTFTTMGGNLQFHFAQFGNIGANNNPPNTSIAINQYKSDATTVISEGGTTNEKRVVFRAIIFNPGSGPMKLQIELRKTTEAFTGFPTLESTPANSGTPVSITSDDLAAVGYKWRYRAMDALGVATDWAEFGASGNTDFVIDGAPTLTAANQFQSDAKTIIAEGGTTNEARPVFKATVSDPDNHQVKLQIELRKIDEAFTGVPTRESNLANSGTLVSVMSDALAAGGYKWRYRAMDLHGLANDWVEFGTPGNTDFVANGAPTLAAVNQFKSDATTVISEGGTTSENKVVFKGTVSDPDGDQAKLQIELRRLDEAYVGAANLQSGLTNSGAQAIVISNNLAQGKYKWRYRVMDVYFHTSAWMDLGAVGNIDFFVADSTPPAAPTNLEQLKLDGVTTLPEGGTTNENKVVFKGTVSDPDGAQVKLQIELRKTTEAFTGVPTLESNLANSGTSVSMTSNTLGAVGYKWSFRAMNAFGLASDWVEFGAPGNADFLIGGAPTLTAANQFKTDATTVIAEGATTVETRVIFQATVSDPEGKQVELQIAMWPFGSEDGLPILQSGFVNSGDQAIVISNTLARGKYLWRYRAVDALGLASNWVEFGTPGKIDFAVNSAPTFGLRTINQFKSDSTTVISEGGTTNGKKVVFKAMIFDPEFEQAKFQIELRRLDEAYTGNANLQSGLINSGFNGGQAVVISDSLDKDKYKWRFRAIDVYGLAGAWMDFGAPANTDFIVADGVPPSAPTNLKQFKMDGITAIPEGGTTNENKIVFKGTVSDSEGEQVKLQIELRKTAEAFTGVPTLESSPANSGTSVSMTSDTLAAVGYKWRYRAMNALGLTTDWAEFGALGNADFLIDGAPTLTAVNQFKSDSTTIIAEGGTTDENKVVFKATVSDPDNDQVKLQIELRKFDEAFIGLPNLQSGLVNSGTPVAIAAENLGAATYKWRFRVMDDHLLAGAWAQFSTPNDTDFIVTLETGISSDAKTLAPTSYRLLQNHPNPFNAGTLITYEIPQAGPVSIKIYNLAGQEILEIVNAVQSPGRYQINWDGRDSQGKMAPSGVYVYMLLVNGFEETRKMTFMK